MNVEFFSTEIYGRYEVDFNGECIGFLNRAFGEENYKLWFNKGHNSIEYFEDLQKTMKAVKFEIEELETDSMELLAVIRDIYMEEV